MQLASVGECPRAEELARGAIPAVPEVRRELRQPGARQRLLQTRPTFFIAPAMEPSLISSKTLGRGVVETFAVTPPRTQLLMLIAAAMRLSVFALATARFRSRDS